MFNLPLMMAMVAMQDAFNNEQREIELKKPTLAKDEFDRWLKERKDNNEKERRHQETIRAIRSTSFWKFGHD